MKYTVVVRLPNGADKNRFMVDAIKVAGLDYDKAEALTSALADNKWLSIGKDIDKTRAEEIKLLYQSIGLDVILNIQLKIQGFLENCPKCFQNIEFTLDGECPCCGFIRGKVNSEILSNSLGTPTIKSPNIGKRQPAERIEKLENNFNYGHGIETPSSSVVALFSCILWFFLLLPRVPGIWEATPNFLRGIIYGPYVYVNISVQALALIAAYRSFNGGVAKTSSLILMSIILIDNALPIISYRFDYFYKIISPWDAYIFLTLLSIFLFVCLFGMLYVDKRAQRISTLGNMNIEENDTFIANILARGFKPIHMLSFSFIVFTTGVTIAKDIGYLKNFGETIKERSDFKINKR